MINKEQKKEYNKRYYESNKYKLKEQMKEYRELNKDKLKEKRKQYCKSNKDKIKEHHKQYRELNKDKLKEHRKLNRNKKIEYDKQYYKLNKNKIREYKKQYHELNKDKKREYDIQYYKLNKDKKREYRELNKDKIKQYHELNKDKKREYSKQYYKLNKDKRKVQMKEYISKRYKMDPIYRLHECLRRRIILGIRNNSISCKKNNHTLELLGCSWQYARLHLEKQFKPEMTWDNYGTYWHVDHIIPVTFFHLEDKTELHLAFHYGNMQPLEASKNYSKHANIPNENFRY